MNAGLTGVATAGGHIARPGRRAGGSGYRMAGKRVLDLLLVILSLPLTLPVIALCAAALWLEGGRPFYTQPRLGRGGRVFRILKLRTMVRDADALLQHYLDSDPALRREWQDTQKLKNDPRITPVGRLLRMTSLDELPQLWNVFKGDMSLVGPRPMMPEQLSLYGDARAYFALRPGITGIWQVSVRNEGSFATRVLADFEYRDGLSLSRDLGLLWRTAGVVMKGTGY
ncbi:sugar transferase [Leisingera caerulea]